MERQKQDLGPKPLDAERWNEFTEMFHRAISLLEHPDITRVAKELGVSEQDLIELKERLRDLHIKFYANQFPI